MVILITSLLYRLLLLGQRDLEDRDLSFFGDTNYAKLSAYSRSNQKRQGKKKTT